MSTLETTMEETIETNGTDEGADPSQEDGSVPLPDGEAGEDNGMSDNAASNETGSEAKTDDAIDENLEDEKTSELKEDSIAAKKDDELSNLSDDLSGEEDKKGNPPSPSEAATTIEKESGSAVAKDDEITTDAEGKSDDPSLTEGEDKKREPESQEGTVAMEVDSPEANEPDQAAEESNKASNESSVTTTTYSTRGRSTEAAAVEEKPERSHIRDAFEESPRPRDPSGGVSFLVEAMTEEERRTRTRFLPDVDGMNMLKKNEIKDDIALASSLPSVVSPSGVLQTRTGRLGNISGRNNDSMDVDGEEVIHAINDESTTTMELPYSTLVIPSDAFVAPKGVVVGDTDTSIEVKEVEPTIQSPSVVESVMSFNPPRPPESVGGKKKHRMIRWERRPEDIEVDMKNYKRTVQRTRQELQKSEGQYERLEMMDAHLRRHFLNHTDLLDREYDNLQDQLEVEVEKLIEESNLVGSRTRKRNLNKVDLVMRDVLTELTKKEQKDVSMDGSEHKEAVANDVLPGIGGLNSQAFVDWERSTKLESMSPCVSWLEPGQRVTTPCGEGTVVAIFPPQSPIVDDSKTNTAANNGNKSEPKQNSEMDEAKGDHDDGNIYDSLLPMRVKVDLGYGQGYFGVTSITKVESPAHFTDAKLAKRWKGMIDSASAVGPCVDLQGMLPKVENSSEDGTEHDDKEMKDVNGTKEADDNFLRVGASLIPTKFGRGNFLHDMNSVDIEETLQSVLYDGHGVLGRVSLKKENGHFFQLSLSFNLQFL